MLHNVTRVKIWELIINKLYKMKQKNNAFCVTLLYKGGNTECLN